MNMDIKETEKGCGENLFGSGYGPVESSCENWHEHLVTIKGEKFLERVNNR
jgi:hypothetical protein